MQQHMSRNGPAVIRDSDRKVPTFSGGIAVIDRDKVPPKLPPDFLKNLRRRDEVEDTSTR
jgi:hypothetical protein